MTTSPEIISTQQGQHVTFTCSATGPPEPMITWSKSQGSLPASSNITSEGKLTILNVTTDDSGSYLCNATSAIGTNSSFVELKVFCSLVHINKPTFSAVAYVSQALKLSCPTSSGSVVLWMHNGTMSLPQESLIQAPHILVIPSLSKDHAGNYSCVSGNSFQWNTSISVKYPETCTKVKQNLCDVGSGDFVIDPDGEQGEAPFTMSCNMTDKGGIGVTAVSHDSENRVHVTGFDPPGSYSRDIHYIGTSLSQVKELMAVSKYCQQFIKYECKGSRLNSRTQQIAWWMSREGETMAYWSEASEAYQGCACAVNSSCASPQKLCNCDKNDLVWREDSGLLTNKSHLPVSQLRFGDAGEAGEEGYHTLGKLECYGMN